MSIKDEANEKEKKAHKSEVVKCFREGSVSMRVV
jgi:hypothetical protein